LRALDIKGILSKSAWLMHGKSSRVEQVHRLEDADAGGLQHREGAIYLVEPQNRL
jgi:hypothetical protein